MHDNPTSYYKVFRKLLFASYVDSILIHEGFATKKGSTIEFKDIYPIMTHW